MSDQYALCVVLQAKPEFADEFAAMVQQNATETRKDKGVVIFNYHKVDGASTWILYEIWESKEDSDAHRAKPAVQVFFEKAPGMLASEPKIYTLGSVI